MADSWGRWLMVLAVAGIGCCTGRGTTGMGPVLREVIHSADAPKAIGPYSQAIRVGNTVYCSGQIPIDPATGEVVRGSIEEQTHLVLKNLGAVLAAAGLSHDDVVKATVYLKDLDHYARVNAVYAEYFASAKPARAAVQVARLPKDVDVEIECIAVDPR